MGLAPYGKAKYYDVIINNLVDIKPDGTFKLDQSFFDYATGLKMINSKFVNLFGQKVRDSKFEKLTQFHMDIAASIQKVTEEIILRICKSLREEYQIKNLCLAGGVALNCVANGAILKQKIFDKIWVQPAAGDAGGSLGAALAIWHLHLKKERTININDSMQGSYLGPEFSQAQIEKELSEIGANFETLNQNEIIERTTERIIAGDAIGWFQGRMEFGPRALGGRSILGDPRSETMQKDLNMKVKYRESFRPFAPSVLEEDFRDWFDVDQKSPYMLIVANVANKHIVTLSEKENKLFGLEKLNVKRSNIPAVTHIDNSARIQTVAKNFNPIFYKLLLKFKEKTGCPILINTSFNVRGEPIVNSPKDAFNCFMGTELDTLVIGNCFLVKKKQSKIQRKNYKNNFSLD